MTTAVPPLPKAGSALISLVAGTVMVLVGLTVLPWFTLFSIVHIDFGTLHDASGLAPDSSLVADYFRWGVYALAVVSLGGALAAALVSQQNKAIVAAVGAITAVIAGTCTLGIAITAHQEIAKSTDALGQNGFPTSSGVFADPVSVGVGPWVTAAGFFALALSGLLAIRGSSAAIISGPKATRQRAAAEAPVTIYRPFDPLYDEVESIVKRWWNSGQTIERLVRDIHDWSVSGGVTEVEQAARDRALDRVNQYARMALTKVAEDSHNAPTTVPPVTIPPGHYDAFGQYVGDRAAQPIYPV